MMLHTVSRAVGYKPTNSQLPASTQARSPQRRGETPPRLTIRPVPLQRVRRPVARTSLHVADDFVRLRCPTRRPPPHPRLAASPAHARGAGPSAPDAACVLAAHVRVEV